MPPLKVVYSLEKLPAPTHTTTQASCDASSHCKKTTAHDLITMLYLLRFSLENWGPEQEFCPGPPKFSVQPCKQTLCFNLQSLYFLKYQEHSEIYVQKNEKPAKFEQS